MQIYYFTRSGRSKKIAETLAVQYQTTAKCIDDHKNWQGKWGYMNAAIMALIGKMPKVDYQKPDTKDKITVVFPLWAGKLPPAVKSFANEIGRGKLICVVTSLGSMLKDREGFAKIIDLVGQSISTPHDL